MEKKELKDLKKMANGIKPMFNIGKNGINEGVLENIDNYLSVNSIVKIKCLNALNKEDVKIIAEEISLKIEADIIDIKGHT
ncbi:YhbY family RNA-binding protein, partial [bacterium]|nr:YhbY family RNA-binding protein [bacterium]